MNHRDTEDTEKSKNESREIFDPERIGPNEHDPLTSQIIGAAIEVHKALGPGYLESVYEEALCIELEHRRIPFIRQHPFELKYRGRPVGAGRLDLWVGGRVIVELKAVEELAPIHTAQVMSYLRATGIQRALLINFNVPVLRHGIHRISL